MNHSFALTCLTAFLAVSSARTARAVSEVVEIGPKSVSQLPGGKEADGIIGDFLLRNDKIEAVVSGNLPLRRANMSTFYGTNGITPGCLYDLTPRGAHNDQLTIFSPGSQQGRVSYVRVVPDPNGDAVVETVITAENNNDIYRRHEYRLRDGWSGVLVTTTIRNGRNEVVRFSPDDRWTAFLRTGRFGDVSWADAVNPADKAGYAYGWVQWEGGQIPGQEIVVEAGREITLSRFVAVGRSPAEAVGLVEAFRGNKGQVSLRLAGPGGQGMPAGTVAFRKGDQSVPGYPDAEGRLNFAFAPGDVSLEAGDLGRRSVTNQASITPEGFEWTAEFGEASAIAVEIKNEAGGAIPCKVQFIGVDGTPSPNLGPHNRAHGCVDQYHSENGKFTVQIAPGTYRVIVTRGIEFSHLEQRAEVRPGETTRVSGMLKRLVDTRGWVSADYHNHSTQSGDNTCGTDDRIINLAAEHIEFAPTTEHNRLYDWRPHIEKLGLSRAINTVSGMELTGSGPHFNSFPFKPESRIQDNGAPVWSRDPRITAVTLRNWQGQESDRWIQINHPDMVENFTDSNGDGLADGGYIHLGGLIDGVEVQNFSPSTLLAGNPFQIYKNRSTGVETLIYNREFVWLQLLNKGHRIIGMAVADAHSVHGNGVGGWRMYMPSRSDEPSEIDWRENSRHAKAGRSILTTGPYLEVRTEDGQGPGSDVRAAGGVKLKIRVQCTDWIDIDRVQILVNGRQEPKLNFTRKSHPDWFSNDVLKFDREVPVPLSTDSHIIVVACHETQDLSFGYGTSDQSNLKPFAYHNPIFVDVDGQGFEPNGDTLGYELMTARYTLEEAKRLMAK